MTEKRYVVKSGDVYYTRGDKTTAYWDEELLSAKRFNNSGEILKERYWGEAGWPLIIEVERVPQPEWREVREL